MVLRRVLLTLAIFCMAPGCLSAQAQVYQLAVGSVTITCGASGSTYLAGALRKKTGPLTKANFNTYRALARKAKADAKKAPTKKKKSKLQKLAASYTMLDKSQSPQCASGPPGGGTPTPTPTPGGGSGSIFDSAGNLTLEGKTLLGIPTTLEANISRGRTVQQNNCVGCHVERSLYTFTTLRVEIAESPMFFDLERMPDQALADLTAYLNRFRP
jgi:hypothetical protein